MKEITLILTMGALGAIMMTLNATDSVNPFVATIIDIILGGLVFNFALMLYYGERPKR